MNTIKELCHNHVYEALEGLYNGLINQSKRKDFEIDMKTFGTTKGPVCFGCAATCTIQELTHTNIPLGEINERTGRANFLKLKWDDLADFEEAINYFRSCIMLKLFYYFDKSELCSLKYSLSEVMTNNNWESLLPELKDIINKLKKKRDMIVKINVTQEDIKKGNKSNISDCPIARALVPVLIDKPQVYGYRFSCERNPTLYELPSRASRFIKKFDAGCEVSPFSFTVDIPKEYLK